MKTTSLLLLIHQHALHTTQPCTKYLSYKPTYIESHQFFMLITAEHQINWSLLLLNENRFTLIQISLFTHQHKHCTTLNSQWPVGVSTVSEMLPTMFDHIALMTLVGEDTWASIVLMDLVDVTLQMEGCLCNDDAMSNLKNTFRRGYVKAKCKDPSPVHSCVLPQWSKQYEETDSSGSLRLQGFNLNEQHRGQGTWNTKRNRNQKRNNIASNKIGSRFIRFVVRTYLAFNHKRSTTSALPKTWSKLLTQMLPASSLEQKLSRLLFNIRLKLIILVEVAVEVVLKTKLFPLSSLVRKERTFGTIHNFKFLTNSYSTKPSVT